MPGRDSGMDDSHTVTIFIQGSRGAWFTLLCRLLGHRWVESHIRVIRGIGFVPTAVFIHPRDIPSPVYTPDQTIVHGSYVGDSDVRRYDCQRCRGHKEEPS